MRRINNGIRKPNNIGVNSPKSLGNNQFAKRLPCATAMALCASVAAGAHGQGDTPRKSSSSALLEEIVITARKREESLQDVPLSVSAYSNEQIEALKVRELGNLSVGMPNVALDDISSVKGAANFSIRGLGVNSSIPSIDPTVGLYVDGVYLGVNNGVLLDVFDLEAIEVLRGPQGTLFGKNVTGGAILMRTQNPEEEFAASIKAAVDGGTSEGSGLNKYVMGSVTGPLGDKVQGKLSVYFNDDDGWFENSFNGDNHGKSETWLIRPAIAFQPTDNLNILLKYEHFENEADGAAGQSHTNGLGVSGTPVNFDDDSFDFAIDQSGFSETETDFFVAQIDLDVEFGDGTVTNIFGWRDSDVLSVTDIDSQPVSLFDFIPEVHAEQYSNELRYNGNFNDNTNITVGSMFFKNEVNYHERRNLLGVLLGNGSPFMTQDGGGNYEVETWSVFAAVDYDLSEKLTLTAGINYTVEEKDVEIASLSLNVNKPCSVIAGSCDFDFEDSEEWESVSPKIGVTYHVDELGQIYSHWSRGYRSGGYNLRNTAQDTVNFGPGPFDQEEVDNFEIGFKAEFDAGRLNIAAFHMQIDDMQREINLTDPTTGSLQVIRNTADTTVVGLEIDGMFALSDSLTLTASLGVLDPEYDKVFFDLNGDGSINNSDKKLKPPRSAELTYSIGLNYDFEVGDWGYATARTSYAYRDDSFYLDSNIGGWIPEQKIIDAGIDFHSNDEHWTFSFYGRNLGNEVKYSAHINLPSALGPVPLGGTYAGLAKGRVIGAEIG